MTVGTVPVSLSSIWSSSGACPEGHTSKYDSSSNVPMTRVDFDHATVLLKAGQGVWQHLILRICREHIHFFCEISLRAASICDQFGAIEIGCEMILMIKIAGFMCIRNRTYKGV